MINLKSLRFTEHPLHISTKCKKLFTAAGSYLEFISLVEIHSIHIKNYVFCPHESYKLQMNVKHCMVQLYAENVNVQILRVFNDGGKMRTCRR